MSSEYKVVTPANAGSNKYIYVSGKTYYKSNTDWDESDDTSSFDAVTSCPPDPGYAPNCTTCPTRSQLASNCGTTARLRFSGDDLYFICNDDPFTSTNLLNNTDFDLTLDSVAAQYQLFYNGCITMTLFCTSGQWYLNLDGNMGPSITNIPLGYAIQPNCCPPSGGTHTVTGYSKTFTLTFP